MNLNIHAGMRVLYKQNGNNWQVGELGSGHALLNKDGLYLPVFDAEGMKQIHASEFDWEGPDSTLININDIFFDAFPIEDWMRIYKETFMSKDEYIYFIEEDDFDKRLENAYVSDGDYGYYPVSKYTRAWLEKQPFDFIVREA